MTGPRRGSSLELISIMCSPVDNMMATGSSSLPMRRDILEGLQHLDVVLNYALQN